MKIARIIRLTLKLLLLSIEVGTLLQLDDHQRQAVDAADQIRPAVVLEYGSACCPFAIWCNASRSAAPDLPFAAA